MISGMFLWEQVVNGIVAGAMYALMALGLALIWGTMRVLNFAHGEFFMLGGFLVLSAVHLLGLPLLPSIAFAVLGAALIAMLLQRYTVQPLAGRPGFDFGTIAVTLGLSIVLQDSALLIWGERFREMPYFIEGVAKIFGVRLPMQRVLIVVVVIACVILLTLLLRFTRFGVALRAVASDSEAASACGINTARVHLLTFGIAAGLAALGGVMLAPIMAVNPWMGIPLLLKAFVVVVLGGLGSLPGAVIGGFMLGIIEALGVALFSSEWREVVAFGVLIVVLWVRPHGLFGAKAREA
jgi:branched-chain amino acid transport system permease protein